MSKTMWRKHVLRELMDDDYAPPGDHQQIVQIVRTRGNNLHEVVDVNQDSYLVSMPMKFRKNIWVKRGSFVVVEPIEEGDKVKAEIVRILTKDHIKYYKEDKVWPAAFINDRTSNAYNYCNTVEENKTEQPKTDSDFNMKSSDDINQVDDSEDDDSDIFVNTNRNHYMHDATSSSATSSSDTSGSVSSDSDVPPEETSD